jgi:ubiquinone/menaquinone biosynthesis C-methylase UbiE
MSSGAPVRLRCPDCSKALGPFEGRPTCPGCARPFVLAEGVWDLLPQSLDAAKANENEAHADAGPPTWRRLFSHKRYWLEWCDRRWLPELVNGQTRSFLEIGGGLCYASSLAKVRAPQASVVATDVSPRYLRQHAIRAGEILGAPADMYAAVDAETLPFDDGQFDAVYSQVVLYRLPDPVRALREIRRVLAPGGRYLGIERASPWLPASAASETRALDARARAQGTRERAIRYREWLAILKEAGFEAQCLAPVPGERVRAPWLRRLGNAVRQIYVAIRLTR